MDVKVEASRNQTPIHGGPRKSLRGDKITLKKATSLYPNSQKRESSTKGSSRFPVLKDSEDLPIHEKNKLRTLFQNVDFAAKDLKIRPRFLQYSSISQQEHASSVSHRGPIAKVMDSMFS